jgi:hypothetical protein
MKPLNQAERRKAYLNFLLLFIITTICVVAAVFFGMRVPFEENKKLQQQIIAYQNAQAFSEKFSARISDLKTLIDTLGSPAIQTESVNNQINSILTDLQNQKDKAVSGNDNIYSKTLTALYDLSGAKYSLAKSGLELQDYNKLNQDNMRLTQRINEANNYIAQLSAGAHLPLPYRSF